LILAQATVQCPVTTDLFGSEKHVGIAVLKMTFQGRSLLGPLINDSVNVVIVRLVAVKDNKSRKSRARHGFTSNAPAITTVDFFAVFNFVGRNM
jgi:hypothetical protein